MNQTTKTARSLVVGDCFVDGETVTRITRGPGTFHTTYETDAGSIETISDSTVLRVNNW